MRTDHVIASAFAVLLFLVGGAHRATAVENSKFQALGRATLSLTQAIERAEQQGDCKAIGAEFETNREKGRYEVKILGGDKLVTYTLDADTGKVLETDDDLLEKLFTRLQPDDVRGAPTTLAQAIGIAQQRSDGKAIAAEVDRDSDALGYDVTVAKSDGSGRDLRIDGARAGS
jgi:uncharacterized membrane protein YkoI